MSDATKPTPIPPTTAEENAATRKAAIAAWHEANTIEKQRAAVKQFPVLRQMYSAAQHIE